MDECEVKAVISKLQELNVSYEIIDSKEQIIASGYPPLNSARSRSLPQSPPGVYLSLAAGYDLTPTALM
jgi:hypothetical protein